jgi:RNA polymerase sigma-70 factor (ECF subfamily)
MRGQLISAEDAYEIEERHTFLSAIRSLPLRQRMIMAYIYDGFTTNEIAAQLNMSPATVRSNLRHARAVLTQRLRPAPEDPAEPTRSAP